MSTTTLRTVATYGATCAHCGIAFWVPEHWDNERREDHKGFYCPNGHSLSYKQDTLREREIASLKRDIAAANNRADSTQERLNDEREKFAKGKKLHAITKGQLTKTKKRIAAGVCPCCNRQFKNLARHMNGQHPGYE